MMTPEEARSRCWAEVDLTRLRQNYRNALKHLTTARLIAVLKADAYGLGAKKVAQVLYGEGQRFFAVASYNEAEELYALGLDIDVLVLGLMGDRQLDQAIEKGHGAHRVLPRVCRERCRGGKARGEEGARASQG